MLCQEDWIAFHPYLIHERTDVTCVIRFAERVIGDCSNIVVLQNKTKHKHTSLYNPHTCWRIFKLYLSYPPILLSLELICEYFRHVGIKFLQWADKQFEVVIDVWNVLLIKDHCLFLQFPILGIQKWLRNSCMVISQNKFWTFV